MAALQSIGWEVKRRSGSHKTLEHADSADNVFSFHDGEKIGPRMLFQIAKHTGLQPGDL
ncbi:type II toxin-antitoxin system HicA family toxin [Synechococcus sp. Cruz CV-v-12]|uniref:type II toxin-antitoxin system HicA family toxin n=1 Tax=Synechococcus sp. Cruz CV-v-12 TaxID=2823728 RepID=UPI0020CDA6B4|nr:type II toxin-antitoxin system HicA family toxin [Synechococcus sp. Cruz CV-v-12]